MNMKGLILSVCYIVCLILIFRGEDLIDKISVRNIAILTLIFSIVITILLFYIF